MIDLNSRDVDLTYNLLLSIVPVSAASNQSIYVLSSNSGCSACLIFLLEQLSELEYKKSNVYIVLEHENVHVMDELKALGYDNLVINDYLFDLLPVSSEINVFLARTCNDRLMIIGYDINIDESLLSKFLSYE